MKKILIITIAAILLCAGVGIASASGSISFASGKSISFASGSTVNISAPTGTIYGYSTHPPSSDPSLAAYYKQLIAVGGSWQRTDLSWQSVQSTSSASYIWGPMDTLVNEAIANGISTMLVIDKTPTSWAATSSCSSVTFGCAPVNAATVATFAAAAAAHFCGRISYWEFWNEQNSNGNWAPLYYSSDYVLDLNASYVAMKAACPGITIATGGLNYTGSVLVPQAVSDYLNDGAMFDMLDLHPYTYAVGVNDPTFGWGVKVDAVRAQLNAAGDSSKKIAITEYGAPTCDSGAGGVSLANQKMEIASAIATSTSAYMNLFQPIFIYTLVDANSNDQSTTENCFGVYYTNGIPKPAYEVLRGS